MRMVRGKHFQFWIFMVCVLTSAWTSTPTRADTTDFNLFFHYGQSHDFWNTVQAVQDNTGDINGINQVIRPKFGKPDIIFSYLDASYAYEHDFFESDAFGETVIGTRAEALGGGEVSNPISPVIRAYANTTGITSFGFRSRKSEDYFFETRAFFGLGPEKRLNAQGAEFLSAIPVRSGLLLMTGVEGTYLDTSEVGEDFFITSDIGLRGTYFHSTVKPPRFSQEKARRFFTLHYRVQNEWLKQVDTYFSENTRVGLLSILSQNPYPFLSLPMTRDYQEDLQFFPGLTAVGGTGGILRFLNGPESPNYSFYAGLFGGAVGGGFDFQYKSFILNAVTYGVRNYLSASEEKTRMWSLSMGLLL